MSLTDSEVSDLAAKVIADLKHAGRGLSRSPLPPRQRESGASLPGRAVFVDCDQAIDAARIAQKQLLDLGLAKRFALVDRMRRVSEANAELWGKMAVEETGMGRPGDKLDKILLSARKTPGPEDLSPQTFTGDHGITLVEPAPFGVVGVITPSTNPPATVVNNAISLVSSGNTCVFNPHPAAKHVCTAVAVALNQAIVDAGGPENAVTIVAEPTQESAVKLMKHKGINLILVTGGSVVVRLAMTSGNRAICAGPGNPPVVVDETAVIAQAGRDIVRGASFDNNILCTDEKEIFVVDKVANALKREMIANGAFEVTGNDADRLTRLVIEEDKIGRGHRHVRPNKNMVGRDLDQICREIDLKPPIDAKLAIIEVNWDHPLVMAEQLMPVIPIVRCRTFEEAMEHAVVAEHDYQHTFVMHSTNVANLSAMAQRCNGNIFVKNGPNLAGLGLGGEGFASMSIAGTTGEGITRASTFTRPRRCTLVDYFRII